MSTESQSDTPTPRTALEQLMSFRHDTFYGREWVLMDDAERLAKQCTQTERELIAANARIAELEAQQPPAPKFLERPDAPGWWWMREPHYKGWRVAGVRMEYKPDESGGKQLVAWLGVGYDVDTINVYNLRGSKWLRATPPQWTPTSEELKS